VHATKWTRQQEETRDQRTDISDQAQAARGAGRSPELPQARLRSFPRGGRTDLAGDACQKSKRRHCSSSAAKTTLSSRLKRNGDAADALRSEAGNFPGATHLFEERGHEQVAQTGKRLVFDFTHSPNDEFVGRCIRRRGRFTETTYNYLAFSFLCTSLPSPTNVWFPKCLRAKLPVHVCCGRQKVDVCA